MAKKAKLDFEQIGPTQGDSGNPSNPSDEIFLGKALLIVPPQAMTMRRPFSEPVRPPMHYLDGPGPDEITTGRHFQAQDLDEGRYGSKMAEGGNRPTSINDKTTNGVEIRGTC